MAAPSSRVDVLVVGAGPTGLALACDLLRHAVTVRIIDQLSEPVIHSKAAVVHARTMEVFDAMGVADAILAHSRPVHGTSIYSGKRRVVHVNLDGLIDSPYPHVYGISQHDTEAVLGAHLRTLGGEVERGVCLESFVQDNESVVATVRRGGGAERIDARWLVGCDGAHSAVRKTLGFDFAGGPYVERLIQTDARLELLRAVDDDEILVFLHERGPALLFPLFRDGRYRLMLVDVGRTDDPPPEPTLADFNDGLRERGIDGRVSDPAWTVGFHIHHRHVERLRDRRVFLAGDAAHIHSPLGGQGMNTGIHDGFNLAWKLALTVRGRGAPSLLDSYEPERLPVIRALVRATHLATRSMEHAVKLRHPLAVGLRDQLMSLFSRLGFLQSQIGTTVSMLGIGYDESPLCAQDRPSVWTTNVATREETEHPSVIDWTVFGSGPAPGARAPDATAHGASGEVRVHQLLRAGRHVVLLFDGAAATEAGYVNLIGIARRLRERFADTVDAHLVIPKREAPPSARWEGPTLYDADGAVHRRYGARSECIYAIRPDGYVGYRCQPADGAKLTAWLARFLQGS